MAGAFGCAPDPNACCTSDADCAAAAACFEGVCAPRCADDGHCGDGEVCLAGACVAPLRAPTHCPFVDKREPRRPTDGGVPADAGGGEPDAGPVDPPCVDAFEPNDDRTQAVPVAPGSYDAHICPSEDDDWYAVTVPPGPNDLSVVVRFEHALGDLDVEVIDENGSRIAVSQLTGDREEIRLPVRPVDGPRELFVHVYGFGRAQNAYTLDVAIVPATGVCLDDALEDNDTDASATPLATGTLLAASFCAGDPDVFRATVEGGVPAYGVLAYERGDELTLEVRSSEGLEGSSSTLSGLELVPFTVASSTTPETVHLRVGGTHGHVDARPYHVGVWVLDDSCGVDPFEPNDLPSEAVPFSVQAGTGFSAVQGLLCEADVDVWRLSWRQGTSSVELSLSAPTGTRGYVVREQDLSLVASFTPGQEAVFAPGISVVSERVLVVLLGTGGEEPYQLRGRATGSE